MSNLYLPEGRLLHTPENQAAWETLSSLRQAMEQETVLEGQGRPVHPGPRSAGEPGPLHRNHSPGGGRPGHPEGTAREIAILSRGGKAHLLHRHRGG